MMSFKFSLIFVELYCLFVVTQCVENSLFDFSDVTSDASSYFYTTRGLGDEPLNPENETPPTEPSTEPETEPVPLKPVYTLAQDFVTDLEVLLHKVTQTFVRIGQKEEGQKTMLHIYNEVFTIASNPISKGSLNYIMAKTLKVLQDPTSSKVVLEFFEMIKELMEYDLVDWYFVVPFLYDINRHPVPEQILGKLKTEVDYIMMSEDRIKSFAAAFSLLEEGLSSAINESAASESTQVPITKVTQIPVKQVESKSEIPVTKVQSNQVSVGKVTQVPVEQVGQATQIPVTKVQSNQVSVGKVTQVPVTQVEQVTPIPVTPVKSSQTVEEQVVPVQVETAAPESKASRLMRKVKSLPSLLRQGSTDGTN